MKEFAKIFHSKKIGQIVAIYQGSDEDGSPEIRVFFMPEGFGVNQFAMKYKDTEEGWKTAEKNFNELTLERLSKSLEKVLAHIV